MQLVDTHCHLEAEEFEGRLDSIVADARAAGVVKLVTASITPDQWPVSRAIAARYPEVAFAWGIHPWYALEEHRAQVNGLRQAREAGAAAIGEIGLDAKVESPPFAFQQELFEAQLRIAKDLDLPVVIHCRGAFNQLFEILKTVGAPGVGGMVHAFSGSVELAEECLKHGLYLSMGGALSYRNSKKREKVLHRVYPDHLVLETDSPDIPPVEVHGTTNVPANIRYNLAGAAAMLGVPEEDIATHTTRNAARLFRFDIEGVGE